MPDTTARDFLAEMENFRRRGGPTNLFLAYDAFLAAHPTAEDAETEIGRAARSEAAPLAWDPAKFVPFEVGDHVPVSYTLKTTVDMWDAIATGAKTAEFRKDDRDERGYQVGDLLRLKRGTDDDSDSAMLTRWITHVVKGPAFGIPEGYAMLSLSEPKAGSEATSSEPHPSASSMGQGDGLDLEIRAAVDEAFAEDLTGPGSREDRKRSVVAHVAEVVRERLRGSSEAREGDDNCVSREAVLERIDAIRPILGGFSPGGAKMGSDPYVTLDAVRQAKHDIALMPSLATPAPAPTTGDGT